MAGEDIDIAYRVYLKDYPDQEISSSFTVKYTISDQCDERLLTEEIFTELP